MRHPTKDKGDTGLGFVIADLLSVGIQVALPVGEHLPFDLIAISETNQLAKVSVKYRKLVRGHIEFSLKSSWADRNGSHVLYHDSNDFDAIAVYCPNTQQCYYMRSDEIDNKNCVWIRVDTPKNNQVKRIKLANDFRDPLRLYARVTIE